MISIKLSQKILEFLHQERGMDFRQIAKIANSSITYLRQIQTGQKTFKQYHIDNIQAKLGDDIFLAMLPDLAKDTASELASKGKTAIVNAASTGKATAIELLQQGEDFVHVKIAKPLVQKLCQFLADTKK